MLIAAEPVYLICTKRRAALQSDTSLKTGQEHGLSSLCKHRYYLRFICPGLADVCVTIQIQKVK